MAAYTCDLDQGQKVYIENQGSRTEITLASGGSGQQQSQRNSFETGNWRVPPTVFRTPSSVVLRIEAEQSQHFIQVRGNRISRLDAAPSLSDAEVLPLRKVETEEASRQSTMPDMPPIKPMKPMPPMQMQMEPMAMRMGNMEMRMETAPQQRQSTKNFCSQCGSKVEEGDRFCSHCGNRLAP
jgi:hypothetical protein